MAKQKKERGIYQGHCECSGCGSSDAGALYLHKDGTYSLSCFSAGCTHSALNVDPTTLTILPGSSKGRVIDMEEEFLKMADMQETLCAMDHRGRRLRAEHYEEYGVLMDMSDDGSQIETIYYPVYREGQMCGYRNRKRFKSWMKDVEKKPQLLDVLKCFYGGVGDIKLGIEMFGQHLFPAGGKRIIITCGEDDTVATRQMTKIATQSTHGKGYPVVSVPSGESIQSLQPNLRYLSSFDEIYIIADNDEQGRKFEEQVCKKLPVGKVKLVRLPKEFKDPCDLWVTAKNEYQRKKVSRILYDALWNAEKYSPAGVKSLSEGWNAYRHRGEEVMVRFPDSFGDLNYKTNGGYALGEILNIIAASSVGKSSIVKEMLEEALQSTPYNIGVVSLEEDIGEYIEGQLSIRMSKQLNEVPRDERDWEAEHEAFKDLCYFVPEEHRGEDYDESTRQDRVHYVDHQGSCTGEELLDKIDFLINGLDCKIIVVDPVTLAFSGKDTDEDDMASEIVKRVKRHKIAWINVHHVRKNGNGAQANSEGADLTEEDIKGTGAWFQTGMINLIFTRNKTHEHPVVRNTMKGVMSKCRRHGKSTGKFGHIWYDGDDGRLKIGASPESILGEETPGGDELEFD